MRFIRGFGQFWYDFLIGDDWKIAVAVTATLVLGAVVLVAGLLPDELFTAALGALLLVAFTTALRIDVKHQGQGPR